MAARVILTLIIVLLAGCSSSPAPREATDISQAPTSAKADTLNLEGDYEALVVNGEQLRTTGGAHEIEVPSPGWRDIQVTFDVHIETVLVLLPPGCADAAQACALRSGPSIGTTYVDIPSMGPGTWRTAMELQSSAVRYGGSQYSLEFEAVVA
jgi:hypothetical protein